MYGSHPAGEGGEYETTTLSMPLYSHRLELVETEVVVTDPEPYPVAYLRVKKARLIPKENWNKPTASELRALLRPPAPLDEGSQELLDDIIGNGGKTEREHAATPAPVQVSQKPLTAPSIKCKLSRRGHWFALSVQAPRLDVDGIVTQMRGKSVSQGFADARYSRSIRTVLGAHCPHHLALTKNGSLR